jgi:hypothetical protein
MGKDGFCTPKTEPRATLAHSAPSSLHTIIRYRLVPLPGEGFVNRFFATKHFNYYFKEHQLVKRSVNYR